MPMTPKIKYLQGFSFLKDIELRYRDKNTIPNILKKIIALKINENILLEKLSAIPDITNEINGIEKPINPK